jgi:hypothetical protein
MFTLQNLVSWAIFCIPGLCKHVQNFIADKVYLVNVIACIHMNKVNVRFKLILGK